MQALKSQESRRASSKYTTADTLLIALLSTCVISAFVFARIPFRIDLGTFISAYWGGTAAQGIFAAVLLCVAGLPFGQTLLSTWSHYSRQKTRFVALAVFGTWMFWLFGFCLGLIVIIDGLALAELLERRKAEFQSALYDVFSPALYFFLGILLVYLLNHAIARIESATTYDAMFNRADLLLFGTTASAVSAWMVAHLAQSFFGWMEFVYRSLYAQIGGSLVITALLSGRGYAVRYVRTLILAYSLALLTFFLWPSIGPFSVRGHTSSDNSSFPPTYQTQEAIATKARLLWEHNRANEVETVNLADYYIGFPSMHIAMPLIAIWFLRKWRRMALILLTFDGVMVVSIIALEWHYFVDLVGGAMVAALSIAVTRERKPLSSWFHPDENSSL